MGYAELEKRKINAVLQGFDEYIKADPYIEFLWSEKKQEYFVARLYSTDGEQYEDIVESVPGFNELMVMLSGEFYDDELAKRGITEVTEEDEPEFRDAVIANMLQYIARIEESVKAEITLS